MSNNVTPEAIKAVLDAFVGGTYPQGDTTLDERSQANIPKFEAVCDWVWDRLYIASKHTSSPYASERSTANLTLRAAGYMAIPFKENNKYIQDLYDELFDC